MFGFGNKQQPAQPKQDHPMTEEMLQIGCATCNIHQAPLHTCDICQEQYCTECNSMHEFSRVHILASEQMPEGTLYERWVRNHQKG